MLIFSFIACVGSAPPTSPAPAVTDTAPTENPPPLPGLVELRAQGPGGTPIVLRMRDGRFVDEPGEPDAVLEPAGVVVPAVIDAHVHIVYFPQGTALARAGVAAAVDLAAPLEAVGSSRGPLDVVWSGPMVTAPLGYPTQSWGSNGYGLEVGSTAEAVTAVDTLHAAGVGVIKVPLTGSARLDSEALQAVVTRAHSHELPVAMHALGDTDAATAAATGADILAHTPTEALTEATVAAWADGAVVSTLVAFGNTDTTRSNLARLHAGGTTVLYGTDLGNTRTPAIDARELEALQSAGLTPAEILHAATRAPADAFGLTELGALEVGRRASFLVLERDPLTDITALATPAEVWLDGARVGP